MAALSRALFTTYLFMLLWLVLFKLSYDPLAVVREIQTRSLNLIPFSSGHTGEMIANMVAFIPFGVMLGVHFKRAPFGNKLAGVFAFSLAVEVIQYILGIGITDVTDVIMNTLGGLIGLAAYTAAAKYANDRSLDRWVLVAGTLVLMAVLYLRIFVFIVRY